MFGGVAFMINGQNRRFGDSDAAAAVQREALSCSSRWAIRPFAAQTEQILRNLETPLRAGSAGLEHVIKWNMYVVASSRSSPASRFPSGCGATAETRRSSPWRSWRVSLTPTSLAEVDAVAVVPETDAE
jgi:enamine deaminase RidA (YjgF/YER057c/UK114 family)